MEPETYNDIWQNYLKGKNDILLMLLHNFGVVSMPSEDRLIFDLRYATAMARLFYARIPEKLPSKNDLKGIWNYYKRYYNTPKGKAEEIKCVTAYKDFTTWLR